MSRRRERANYDGSVSLVGTDARPEGPLADMDIDLDQRLTRLFWIMDMINGVAIGFLEAAIRNKMFKSSTQSQVESAKLEAEQANVAYDLRNNPNDLDGMAWYADRLSSTSCYTHWSRAWDHAQRVLEKGKCIEAENLFDLWRDAIQTFDGILEAHGTRLARKYGQGLIVPVRHKILTLEGIVESVIVLTDMPSVAYQDILNSSCVTPKVRINIQKASQRAERERIDALHTPDLVSLIAAQSTLTAAVSITTFCATALLGIAWKYSTPDIGSVHDMSFWFSVQSLAMSLLGFFTATFPLSRRSWGSPWRWSLALCVLGTASSLLSIPAFLTAGEFWSSALSFVATVSQAGLTLQLSLLAMQPQERKKKD